MLKLDPIWQADIQQRHFRQVLEVMSRPGLCQTMQALPQTGSVALSVLATLLDAEVSLADPYELLRADDWLMLQARPALTEQADYILCRGEVVPDFMPKSGTLASPELSATVILLVDSLEAGDVQLRLSGPGIKDSKTLAIAGIDPSWIVQRDEWNAAFPLGVDMILIGDGKIAALPRTTKVEVN